MVKIGYFLWTFLHIYCTVNVCYLVVLPNIYKKDVFFKKTNPDIQFQVQKVTHIRLFTRFFIHNLNSLKVEEKAC